MQECVWECLESLKEGLTLTDAVTVLQEVPEELRGHEAMAGVTEKVVAILSKALNEFREFDPPTIQKGWKQRIGDALANALGPVNQLFGESPWHKLPDDSFYTCLPLKTHVLALSLTAIEDCWQVTPCTCRRRMRCTPCWVAGSIKRPIWRCRETKTCIHFSGPIASRPLNASSSLCVCIISPPSISPMSLLRVRSRPCRPSFHLFCARASSCGIGMPVYGGRV